MPDIRITHIDVKGCARCGDDHDNLTFREFEKGVEVTPGVEFGSWALCPHTEEPLLMWTSEDDEKPAPDPATWSCKIGEVGRGKLDADADATMRESVRIAYFEVAGVEPDFVFSGWGTPLTPLERSEVEERPPSAGDGTEGGA